MTNFIFNVKKWKFTQHRYEVDYGYPNKNIFRIFDFVTHAGPGGGLVCI